METIRKIYRALRSFTYVTNIKVNGKSEIITFDGGSRTTKTNGFFVTDNKEVQQALEALPQFKTDFYLQEAFLCEKAGQPEVPPTREVVVPAEPEPTPEPDEPAPEAEQMNSPVETPDEPEAEQPKDGSIQSVAGVTSAGAAKLQLVAMFPDDKSRLAELKKADEIRAFAKEKGVVFPDWL